MSLIDDNIRNAMKIVRKTQENVGKLMTFTKNLVKESDFGYILLTENFLRYSSDADRWGWTFGSFILLFKRNDDIKNIIYGMQIDLDDAAIRVAKYFFDNEINYETRISPAESNKYTNPLWGEGIFDLNPSETFTKSVPKADYIREKYSGLNCVMFAEFPLSEINAGNVQEKIFGTFDKLAELKS